MGRLMVAAGCGLVLLGALVWATGRWMPGLRLGRLPGDIVIEQPTMSLYIPITTMILISGVLSLIFWLIGALRR